MDLQEKVNQTKPRLLPKDFLGKGEVSGYKFRQIKRGRYVYIYEVDNHYEVFKRIINRQYNCESYPSSKQFGKTAFVVKSLSEAAKKYSELTKKYKTMKKMMP